MNKIVREHYPATKLPKDLRPTDDPTARVTVIIEEERKPRKALSLEKIFSVTGFHRKSAAQIDASVRRRRNEWQD
jgi:hypothetical protein